MDYKTRTRLQVNNNASQGFYLIEKKMWYGDN